MKTSLALRPLLSLALGLGLGVDTQASPSAAAASNPGAALGLEPGQDIVVNADSFLADLNGETGTYTGNVVVSQGNVKLHADKVTVTAPKGRATRMEATGHVVVDSPSGQAIGENGVYDVAARMLHLTGHVVLTKDSNVLRGTALDVSMATGIARLTAAGKGAEAANTGAGRVQGLFSSGGRSDGAAGEAAEPSGRR